MRAPSWWNSTVTVYKRSVDEKKGTTSWERTVLKDVFLKIEKVNAVQSDTLAKAYNCVLRVPDINETAIINTGDIIVSGEVTDVIDESIKGSRSSELIARYKERGCFVAASVRCVSAGAPLPHQLVKG